MSWDESLFKTFYEATRSAFRRRGKRGEAGDACRLDDQRQRLQLLACALAGEHMAVQPAEGDGGWRGDVVLLPATMSFGATPEDNLRGYILRVAWACTSRTLGFVLDPTAAGDGLAQALQTWLAVPATREAMLATLPGAVESERAACAAALAVRPSPRRQGPAAALEAFVRLRLGAEPDALGTLVPAGALDWARAADAQRPATPDGVHEAARSLLPQLGAGAGRRVPAPPVVPLWGWLLPAAAPAVRPAAGAAQEAGAPSRGGERHAGPRDDLEVVTHPEDPLGENPLVHSFEKVHTVEQYTGGRKRMDASDELEAHGDALDEAAPRQVVRSSHASGSV